MFRGGMSNDNFVRKVLGKVVGVEVSGMKYRKGKGGGSKCGILFSRIWALNKS